MASFFVDSLLLLLPPSLADAIQTHILRPTSPFQIYTQEALAHTQRAYDILLPRLEVLYHQAVTALYDAAGGDEGPAAAALATLPLILSAVAAIAVVTLVTRLISWWTRMMMKVAFWGVIIILLLGVWERGLVASARDVVVVASKLAGYGAAVREIWVREYQHYEEQTRSSSRAHHTRR